MQLGVLQFSNDTRVEIELKAHDKTAFADAVARIERLNGGTNMLSPLRWGNARTPSRCTRCPRRDTRCMCADAAPAMP